MQIVCSFSERAELPHDNPYTDLIGQSNDIGTHVYVRLRCVVELLHGYPLCTRRLPISRMPRHVLELSCS